MTYLSMDIGGTFIKYAKMNEDAVILQQGKVPTPSDHLIDFMNCITMLINSFPGELDGIAISCPGTIDTDRGIVYYGGALTYLDKVPLGSQLMQMFGVPTILENDGKCAALAELRRGNLKGVTDGAVLVLGTGLGGGIILNGQLRRGIHQQAGEFSCAIGEIDSATFKTIGFGGSSVMMIKRVAEKIGLNDLTDGKKVFNLINQGNEQAVEIFDKYCMELARFIVSLQGILDLERMIIGGGISAQPILTQRVRQFVHQIISSNEDFNFLTGFDIVPAKFYNDANLIGALYTLLDNVAKKYE